MKIKSPILFASSLSVSVAGTTADSNVGTFAWLTDAHLDRFYGTPQAKIHKLGAPCNLTDAPSFSAYGCGGPLPLVEAAVQASANANEELGWPSPDFVLFTGDNTRHNPLTPEGTLEDIRIVNNLFRTYFPDTPVVKLPTLDLGNNDLTSDYYLNITTHEPCLPTNNADGTTELPPTTNKWLGTVAEEQSHVFVNELEKATFACGGYMNRELPEGLDIIILKTIIWSISHEHEPVPTDDERKLDPFGQFAWLEATLTQIREAGRKVYITGHVPPMLQSFTGNLGVGLYHVEKQERLFALFHEFEESIAAILFAHTHSNELRHTEALPDHAPPALIGTSISPCYTTDPGFRIVKYDLDTYQPVDMATYSVNLGEEIPEDETNPFNLQIPSLVDYLGMESLTNHAIMKLADNMLDDNEVWNNYFNNFYKGVTQTACDTAECRRGEVCLVACGFSETTWNSCNSSAVVPLESACGFDDTSETPSEEGKDGDKSLASILTSSSKR
mmetsp:Transcript_32464/g.58686  ORF Transcript_32464/g.58686 Transcript_32464/m.58686 type:complete len:501 (-) Transcript_32464:272-1774(-)